MDKKGFRALVWRLQYFTRNLNGTAVLGIGLLAFEAGFYLLTLDPLLEERTILRVRVLAQSSSTIQGPQPVPPNIDPHVDLAKFYAALERTSQAPALLRRLYANADVQGLRLQQADYRPVPDSEGKILRYQILIPAKGTYPDIRRFLAQTSRDLPGLAIDGISFQRQQIGDRVVQAQIKLTLFLGAPS
jgi:hypothetical protein